MADDDLRGRRGSSSSSLVRKWKADSDKSCLVAGFEKRGWLRTTDDDWTVYWANVHNVKHLFSPDSGYRLQDHQLINHFPNHYEMTRKDLMVKNIKRYKKDVEKESSQVLDADGNSTVYDFVPLTFTLPADYCLFVEEYKKHPNAMWIMKPTAKARGIGIFLVTKLSQIKRWARDKWPYLTQKDQYVISRYIENPLLIGGKKFDLRMYVLVTSYRPLKAYIHKQGFGRFCTKKYTKDIADVDDMLIHLTNVSLQKQSAGYNDRHGGKWSLDNLRLYLEATYGLEATERLFHNIRYIFYHTLKACQQVMINDKHCFECYGFDIIIDDALKPWLVEVNASPSLSATTNADRILKHSLIDDLLSVVAPSPADARYSKSSGDHADSDSETESSRKKRSGRMGDFEVLVDESSDYPSRSMSKERSSGNLRPSTGRRARSTGRS